MNFERIVFRSSRTNRYSVTALTAAILSRLSINVLEAKSLEEILQLPVAGTVVAYSFMSFDFEQVATEIDVLSRSGYIVIAGGPHASANPRQLLEAGAHYVFIGDGEQNIVHFLSQSQLPEEKIYDGINERVNLDDFPAVCEQKKLFMPIEISRGCPFNCGYCQTPRLAGKIVRHRSIDAIVEAQKIMVKHGKTVARFITPNAFGYGSKNGVTPNPEVIDELLHKVKLAGAKEIYFGTFPSDVRPESVTPEVLKVIKKYVNHNYIVIGAQSGSNRILKMIQRGHTVEQVEQALEVLAEQGFYAKVDFIFGFPFETREDVEETFKFIERIVRRYHAKIHAHTFMPLPGTPLWNVGPGQLKDFHYKFLGRLAAQGILDGYWLKQQTLAQKVAKLATKDVTGKLPSVNSVE